MFQLRRVTDQVFNRRAADRAASGLAEMRERAEEVRERGGEIARMAYEYAMSHRKASAAVMLGAGIAAALIYMANRKGTRRRAAQAQ